MGQWYLGTMGFSWKDWKGSFYPANLNSSDFLAYYSRIFNAVEIDATFYGIPRPEVVEKWAASTPDGFKICSKMPKQITHEMELVNVEPVLDEYIHTIRKLEDRLGVILIQFRPSFTIENYSKLETFLDMLPDDVRFAVEFRHRSWYNSKTEALLSERNLAWAATEYLHLPKRIYRTTNFLYVRFIGYHGRFKKRDRVQLDVSEQLKWWKENIEQHLDAVDEIYGFFNNDYSGFAAGTCNEFRGMVGLGEVDFSQPRQDHLF